MKVLIVGLGSMGKRRLRLLRSIDDQIGIVGVDSNPERCKQVVQEYGIQTFSSIEEACSKDKPDVAVVSTSPISHAAIIQELLSHDLHVFTEINLVADRYYENMATAKEKNKVLFLSSTFLYRNDIQHIIERVGGKKVSYHYHVGQYLPDWHPWESFKDFFVADRRTNGCREILAIDFPWLISCFGEIQKVSVVKETISSLKLGYPDTFHILTVHENGSIGSVAIDVVARKAGRKLEVYDEDMHVFWDGTPDSLAEYDPESKELKKIETYQGTVEHNANYNSSIIENAYRAELEAFLYEVQTGKKDQTRYSFEKDLKLLMLLDEIEQ